MFILGGPPPTPEERDAYSRLLEQHSMAHEAVVMDIQRLFGELSPESLAVFRYMMHSIVSHETPRSIAGYFEGQAAAILNVVHGVCSGCGQKHEDDVLDQAEGGESADVPPVS